MVYTQEQFGRELKQYIVNEKSIESIGHWVYSIYMVHMQDIDNEFRDTLLRLNMMEDEPEFAYSYEELNKIANDLISGKQVKL